jgi:uncharacterized protein YjbJ (UPF0337 family)
MSLDQIEGSAKQGIGRVQETVGDAIGDTGMQAKGVLDEAVGAVQQTYGRVSDTARGAFNQAADRARGARGDFEDFAGENPVLVAGIALGIGLAFGLLLLGGSRLASSRR